MRWAEWSEKPLPLLARLFAGRMFHGGSELGAEELDLGIGVTAILLAMPGILTSLLLFDKYGSLIRFLRGDGVFDPFEATIPDEYFFIVLSMVVTGIATIWKWTAIFPDRRDFANLVHLPLSLRDIFLGNLAAIAVMAALYTLVVNAASILLFPTAVVGSQGDLGIFMRFLFGHALSVLIAGVFAFSFVFALTGILLALFPYGISRRISLLMRFLAMVSLLAFIASSFSVPDILAKRLAGPNRLLGTLPPVWFLGLSQRLWGRATDPFFSEMTRRAIAALVATPIVAVTAYLAGFRRSFQKIPEISDLPLLRRSGGHRSEFPDGLFDRFVYGNSIQRVCGRFILQTLSRSEVHQQVLLFFVAVGIVACAKRIADASFPFSKGMVVPLAPEYLSVPLILAFSVIVGVRFCFEMPLDLRANWIFRFWIEPRMVETRSAARKLLLLLSLSWLAPITFACSLYLWGLFVAILHTLILVSCSVLIVEISMLRFRKIPFTCEYPPFESHSPLIAVAYGFAFLVLASLVPQGEQWAVSFPWAAPALFVPVAMILIGLHQYRKSMLQMDKDLIFEEPQNFLP